MSVEEITVPLLQMQDIHKSFPGVVALDSVNLDLVNGEIHALVGENGAGKSTLIKVLTGVYKPDAGTITLNGVTVEFAMPADALLMGIAVIHQEIPLVPTLSVLSNVFLGRELTNSLGLIANQALKDRYLALCDRVGIYVEPNTLVRDLTRSQAQLVEILKALDRSASIIVMDEPTAALDNAGKKALFQTVRQLQARGTTFVFISHFIDEVFELADRITILRDGRNIATLERTAATPEQVIGLMVGHLPVHHKQMEQTRQSGRVALDVKGVSVGGILHDITFQLREGEVLGLAGLLGSGRTELILAILGQYRKQAGEIQVSGQAVKIDSPRSGLKYGIAMMPEDRKRWGLILNFEVYSNLSLSSLDRFSFRGLINSAAERKFAWEYIRQLDISTPSAEQPVRFLSGGNQQKVVLGRMLATNADILILDEPTQGIDVGAKQEIFSLINRLACEGKSILFISSEFQELAAVSDRCLVLKGGRIISELQGPEISEANLKQAAILGHINGE